MIENLRKLLGCKFFIIKWFWINMFFFGVWFYLRKEGIKIYFMKGGIIYEREVCNIIKDREFKGLE